MHRRTLDRFGRVLGSDHTSASYVLCEVDNLYEFKGKAVKVETTYRRALAGFEKTLGPDDSMAFFVTCGLGLSY